jgi:hypothetical protein
MSCPEHSHLRGAQVEVFDHLSFWVAVHEAGGFERDEAYAPCDSYTVCHRMLN